MLFNADILQNFRLGEVNPEKQKAAKTTLIQKLKTATKVYANPGPRKLNTVIWEQDLTVLSKSIMATKYLNYM